MISSNPVILGLNTLPYTRDTNPKGGFQETLMAINHEYEAN
jgi:hypothetical protein